MPCQPSRSPCLRSCVVSPTPPECPVRAPSHGPHMLSGSLLICAGEHAAALEKHTLLHAERLRHMREEMESDKENSSAEKAAHFDAVVTALNADVDRLRGAVAERDVALKAAAEVCFCQLNRVPTRAPRCMASPTQLEAPCAHRAAWPSHRLWLSPDLRRCGPSSSGRQLILMTGSADYTPRGRRSGRSC